MAAIRDIVNRDIVNLINCEHEPIHIPGSIQPHGFLMALALDSDRIEFCSGNVFSYISVGHGELLGNHFSAIFGNVLQDLEEDFHKGRNLPHSVAINGKLFQCSLHSNGTQRILECEPEMEVPQLVSIYNQTVDFLSYMNGTSTLREMCDLIVKGMREMTGYDRVMVYRFDKDYNGEVFAESVREDLESFLGLHYPHTDIPVQARQLYMKNLIRLIVDVSYQPVPLYTLDDEPGKNLDLSLSILRSTSPIHVEYLQNIGVGATLTISLIHRDRLWGLIACHHYSPKNLTADVRLAAQLQGQFIMSQLDVRQSNEEYAIARRTNMALERLTSLNLPPVPETFKIISLNPDLLRVANATGVSILVSGTVYKNGNTPHDDDIVALSEWLDVYSNESHFSTEKLIHFLPDRKFLLEKVSGILYHSLGNGNSVIWYRPESVKEVNWAGDPEKAIIRDSKGLHPRNSFNLWKQFVKDTSKQWMQPELNAAANFAHALQKQIGLLLMSREEEKYRHLSEILKETNSELENINWISTHDLQEPLRKIQLIASRLISREGQQMSPEVQDALSRLNASAHRMQMLLIDILKYTRIKHSDEALENVDLNEIVGEVVAESVEALKEKEGTVSFAGLPVVKGVPFLLKQLFSNLILNSMKYGQEGRKPAVRITLRPETTTCIGTASRGQLCYAVEVKDNGIGFQPQYAESIFNIFTRLHNQNVYKGSGVGLALCKKIMQMHHGAITAASEDGEGATFTLYFPVADGG